MTTYWRNIIIIALATITCALVGCGNDKEPAQQPESNKAERNFIRKGNELFANKQYADAEIEYSKALQANPASAIAAYNMGLSLAMQAEPNDSTGITQRADSLFNFAASVSNDKTLKSMAYYNMGNLAYNNQRYDKAIEDYKNALRAVPTDEDARYNLRMAQLKQQQQQQQQQNQDQNKQDQDKNQQDQQNQNQDQQQQQQDQNQDQKDNGEQGQNGQDGQQQKDQQQGDQQQNNQDQNNQQDQQQNQQQNQQQGNQQQQQQQSGGDKNKQQGQAIKMDEQSIGQVLKAMQDKEKETQQKLYQRGNMQQEFERHSTKNKW